MSLSQSAFNSLVVMAKTRNHVFTRQLKRKGLPFVRQSFEQLLADNATFEPDEILLVNFDFRDGEQLKKKFPNAQVLVCHGGAKDFSPELFVIWGADDYDTHYYEDWGELIKLLTCRLQPLPKIFVRQPQTTAQEGLFKPAVQVPKDFEMSGFRSDLFGGQLKTNIAYLQWYQMWLEVINQKDFPFKRRFRNNEGSIRRLEIRVTREFTFMGLPIFNPEDTVVFHGADEPETGTVKSIDEQKLVVVFPRKISKRLVEQFTHFSRRVGQKLVGLWKQCCDELQTQGFPENCSALLALAGEEPNDGFEGLTQVQLSAAEQRILRDRSQTESLLNIIGPHRISVVEGFGGGGKTTVTAVAVKQFFRQGKVVLILSHSNQGLDVLVEAVAKTGVEPESIFRLGNDHQSITVKGLPFHRSQRFKGVSQGEVAAIRELIDQGRGVVIACTMGSLQIDQTISYLLQNVYVYEPLFDITFVDEATRGFLFELLPAFLHTHGKIVFIGDHRQLGNIRITEPAVRYLEQQEIDQPNIVNFQKGLFYSLLDSCAFSSTSLEINRRALRNLCRLVSQLFYEGKMKPGRFSLYSQGQLIYLDTVRAQNRAEVQVNTSRANPREARLVASQVMRLVRNGTPFARIGVITPYRAQIQLIRRELRERLKFGIGGSFSDPETSESLLHQAMAIVNTVDAFQGSERDVIILSLVCSNDEYDIGFNQDIRRWTVSLTRARNRLIVIGDSETFQNCSSKEISGMFADFVAFVKQYGRYQEVV